MRIALARSREPAHAGEVDAPLVEALERRGATVTQPCWDDETVDWAGHDLVAVRTTWDYAPRREAFLAWAERIAERVTVVNPPDVLRWNTHKGYLIELEERGAPVVPTAWLGQGDRVSLDDLLAARGWSSVVVKPAVAVGGHGALQAGKGHTDEAQHHLDALLAEGDVLVQPFLGRVEQEGELSVVLVGGEVTHAVRKRPTAGEFRVHEHYGGRYEREEPSRDVAALARWLVESTGQRLLMARVDLIADELGTPQVVEVEATEPDLLLRLAPDAADLLADALLDQARTT